MFLKPKCYKAGVWTSHKLMKNRPAVNTALLFSPCLHMSGDHLVNCTRTSENSQRTRCCTAHKHQGQMEIKWFHTQVCFQQKGLKHRAVDKKFSDDNHIHIIPS